MSDRSITINGKKVDLADALPLTYGEWKRLRKQFGITAKRLTDEEDDAAREALMLYVLQKVDPGFTTADLDATPNRELIRLVKILNQFEAQEDGGDPNS